MHILYEIDSYDNDVLYAEFGILGGTFYLMDYIGFWLYVLGLGLFFFLSFYCVKELVKTMCVY